MKPFYVSLLAIAGIAASSCAPMDTTATLQVSSAPPPPVVEFTSDPQFRYLSDLRVSVIADDGFGYDMFLYGGSYYLCSNDIWYRSSSPRGPFIAVEARRVPRPIFIVSDDDYHWRHHPQGWRGRHRGHDRGDDHDNGHGYGR